MSDKPYIPPKVIPSSVPTLGNMITRPQIGSNTEYSYDPYAIQSGQETYKYAEVALHPCVKPGLEFMTNAPFWSGWHIEPNNNYELYPGFEAIDDAVIDLINYQIETMRYETFQNSLINISKDGLIYGFPVGEKIFVYDGRYWCLRQIKAHSPHLFDFWTDEAHELDRIYYRLTGLYIDRKQLDKFIIAPYPTLRHGRYYGESALKSIYFDVQLIDVLEKALAEGVRRLSVRPIIHHYIGENKSQEELTADRNALYEMDSGSVISFPAIPDPDGKPIPQHDVRVLEDRANPEGTVVTQAYLETLYKRVNRNLGIPDDLGFTSTGVGSLAKSKEEMSLFTQNIVRMQEWIENWVNKQVMPSFIQYNYPSLLKKSKYQIPVFRFGTIEEDFDLTKSDMISQMLDKGVLDRNDRAWIRDEMGFPPATEEIESEIVSEETEPEPENNMKRITDKVKLEVL